MKTIIGMVLLAALASGCFKPSDKATSSHYDPITGGRTDVMQDNMLTLETEDAPREVVWLNATRDLKGPRGDNFYLEAVYMAREETGYLDIGAGESLTVVADGRRLGFFGSGSAGMRRAENGFVHERAVYRVTRVQIQTIAIAREVKVEIRGENGLVERKFQPDNFGRFRTFVSMYAL